MDVVGPAVTHQLKDLFETMPTHYVTQQRVSGALRYSPLCIKTGKGVRLLAKVVAVVSLFRKRKVAAPSMVPRNK